MSEDLPARPHGFTALARMQTGAKLFLILSVALLPLALIGVAATLQTSRSAEEQARARLRLALSESSRALSIELAGDMTALRAAIEELETDPNDSGACARVQGVFSQQFEQGIRFSVADTSGDVRCGGAMPRGIDFPTRPGRIEATTNDTALTLTVANQSGKLRAAATFPANFLRDRSRPSAFLYAYGEAILQGDKRLTLSPRPDPTILRGRSELSAPMGIDDLTLEMVVRNSPISSSMIVTMLLPLIMWFAAAAISWFVVDRLLIRPLRQLRADVAGYVPGEIIDPAAVRALPAQEIRELGDTFRAISRTVAIHENDLAAALGRQTRLTKEVHHRVKNNLQVITSLINLHARSAKAVEATDAYASIQRRVDALAVVHRNHFAEMEDNRGLSLRSILGELASNIRATAPSDSAGLGITLDVEPFMVGQDVAVATAFVVTELIELALSVNRIAQIRLSAKSGEQEDRAVIRVSSAALVDGDTLQEGIATRFGRVLTGLARQLRSSLHHDPLTGAYEISIPILGRD